MKMLNRPTDIIDTVGTTVCQYDSLGQVTSEHKLFADGTPVPGQQFDYSFDTIGNRTQTKTGGDQTGGNQRVAAYTANTLNQYTSRDYPGTNDVIGAALATNGVTVNGTAAWRKGEYFWATVKTNNTASPAWLGTTVTSGGITNTGHVYMPQTPEQFSYDADGNLTNDGRWAYTWDAENRLIQMTVNTNVGPQYQMTFGYDFQGRRIQKIVATNGVSYATNNFLYDGWNLIAILNSPSSILQSFVWGSDLSGSMQGAGGVGGLLEVSYYGSSTTNAFVAYDGNGNVSALVNAADGTMLANYEYDPFGQTIRSTGSLAKNNPFRFSTKYQDDESDRLYYGYRFYNPSTGRWLSRDPANERGGINLFGFAKCDPLDLIDALGLDAKGTVTAKLAETYNLVQKSAAARTTGFYRAIYYYYSVLLPKISATYGNVPSGATAQYEPSTHTMILENDLVGDGTIVHEMTHAFNDIVMRQLLNDRTDEGMAYTMQSYYELAVRLETFENSPNTTGCNYYYVKNMWQNFWLDYGMMPSPGWGKVSFPGLFGTVTVPVQEVDYDNVKYALGVHLSCHEIRDAINSVLAQHGCCFRVACSGTTTPCGACGGLIAPLNPIMPIFK